MLQDLFLNLRQSRKGDLSSETTPVAVSSINTYFGFLKAVLPVASCCVLAVVSMSAVHSLDCV